MEGQRKRFDLETQDACISAYQRLEARARRFLHMSVIALITDTNTSVLDRLYKTRQQWALKFSGPQIAKELDSREDIVPVIITEVVDSEFRFLPSQALQERRRGS